MSLLPCSLNLTATVNVSVQSVTLEYEPCEPYFNPLLT